MPSLARRLDALEAKTDDRPAEAYELDLTRLSDDQLIDWHRIGSAKLEDLCLHDFVAGEVYALMAGAPVEVVGIHGGEGVKTGCDCGYCKPVRIARELLQTGEVYRA